MALVSTNSRIRDTSRVGQSGTYTAAAAYSAHLGHWQMLTDRDFQ